MDALETPTALYQDPSLEALQARLDSEQRTAAMRAGSIGEFKREFQGRAQELLEDAGDDGAQIDGYLDAESRTQLRQLILDRQEIIDQTVHGNEATLLDTMEANVLGQNYIDGGKSGATLNRKTFADLRENAKSQVDHTIAHEHTHGDQVALHGRIKGFDEQPDSILLYEGHAQVRAQEETGVDGSEQPDALYGKGERLMRELIRNNARQTVERVLTETGDLGELKIGDGGATEVEYVDGVTHHYLDD